MTTIEQMVQREVLCCMSSLVSTLDQSHALSAGQFNRTSGLADLILQAHELAASVLDYEEAAREYGWHHQGKNTPAGKMSNLLFCKPDDEPAKSWEQACEMSSIYPYEWEVYEHWAVSQWFAECLIAQGERVDIDFAGLNIWARTATGQAISMDGVVQKIYREMVK